MDRSLLILTTLVVALISTAAGRSALPTNTQPACDDEGRFQCRDQQNVPCTWTCDGMQDCPQWEDETGCQENNFAGDQGDDSDIEEAVESWEAVDATGTTACFAGDFQCTNQECVPVDWRCDNDPDCEDGSDERNCENYVRTQVLRH